MDIQDAQDKQDGTLLQRKLALAMIRNGFADARECSTTDLWKKILCILSIDVNCEKSFPDSALPGCDAWRLRVPSGPP